MDELILGLIELVKSTAPVLWQIAERQVLAQTVEAALFLVVFLFMFVVCLRVARKYTLQGMWDDDSPEGIIALAGIALSSIAVFLYTSMLIGRVVSPGYYAIKALMDLVQTTQ